MRNALDQQSDFVNEGMKISFRHTLETLEANESFCLAPPDIVDAARRILTFDLDRSLSRIVHDNVTMKIGGNRVPLFAMVRGSFAHTLLVSMCVSPLLCIHGRADPSSWELYQMDNHGDLSQPSLFNLPLKSPKKHLY